MVQYLYSELFDVFPDLLLLIFKTNLSVVSITATCSTSKIRYYSKYNLFSCPRSPGVVEGGREMSVVAAAKPGSVNKENTPNITATVTFTPSRGMMLLGGRQHLYLDRISLMDHDGNR
jgi:hypothetical protein